jgi:hypothetical protein
MELQYVAYEDLESIQLASDMAQWWILVNTEVGHKKVQTYLHFAR